MRTMGEMLAEQSERNRKDIHHRLTLFPSLEPTREEKAPEPKPIQSIGYQELSGRFERWMGMLVHLENRFNLYLDKSSKRKQYKYK